MAAYEPDTIKEHWGYFECMGATWCLRPTPKGRRTTVNLFDCYPIDGWGRRRPLTLAGAKFRALCKVRWTGDTLEAYSTPMNELTLQHLNEVQEALADWLEESHNADALVSLVIESLPQKPGVYSQQLCRSAVRWFTVDAYYGGGAPLTLAELFGLLDKKPTWIAR